MSLIVNINSEDKCIICLEECNVDILDYKEVNKLCECKYKIHNECLEEYMNSMNGYKCMICKKELYNNSSKCCCMLFVEQPAICLYSVSLLFLGIIVISELYR